MNRVYIIAEAGVNHNGSLETAKQLIKVAYESGADAVKFQAFKAETLATRSAKKAVYQVETTGKTESQFEMLKKLELDIDSHKLLKEYASHLGIDFLSSPFDIDGIEMLNQLGMRVFKIPSGEITNLPYLRVIGELKKEVILSTGMATLGEIESAIQVLTSSGTPRDNITVLHCNTEYPTPMCDVNLKAMNTIKEAFKIRVGYSDHTLGIEIPIAAVAMGAMVIEKHFTLDKSMDGPDHRASLEPSQLKKMVQAIRNIEKAMGDGIKQPSDSEKKNKEIARKSIVAKRNIEKGETFSKDNLTVKRPGHGITPMAWDEMIGRTAMKNYLMDEVI